MKGDIALAGFWMTAEEWEALDAPSRALLMAVATKPEDLANHAAARDRDLEPPVEMPVFPIGSAPISDDESRS